MTELFDVVILGGGPAGCATAIALRQLGVGSVLVVEASDYTSPRIGESIPPDSRLALARLGLWKSFAAQGHDPCLGSRSSWGSDRLGYNDFLVNPNGNGWHLDRLRFDRWLAERVEGIGIELRRRTRFRGVTPGPRRYPFHLQLDGPEEAGSQLLCRFAVDATGRRARLARSLGSRPREDDRLVFVAAYLDAAPGHGLNSLTLLEAVEYGYWYAAKLPGGRLTAAVASDADIVKKGGLSRLDPWRSALDGTRHLGPATVGCSLKEGLHTWFAPSTLLDPPAGPGWLAVGDAAAAYDPISSQGVHKALTDALAAATAIAAWLSGRPLEINEYRDGIARRYFDYLQIRDHFYDAERRWADAPFWRRRRARSRTAATAQPRS